MRDYDFGNLIFELRKEKNLTQSQLGEKIGVSNKTVSKWENGITKPDVAVLYQLADFFEVSAQDLATGKIVPKETIKSAPILSDPQPLPRRKIKLFSILALLLCLAVLITGSVALIKYMQIKTVPAVAGKSALEAENMLYDAKLKPELEYAFSDTVPEGFVISQSTVGGSKLKKGSVVGLVVSRGVEEVYVPSVINKTLKQAQKLLESMGLTLSFEEVYHDSVPSGYVISQSLKYTSTVKKGSEIHLTVSRGFEYISVPSVANKIFEKAENELLDLGFKVSRNDAYSNTVAKGYVISQSITPFDAVKKGSLIELTVSLGAEYTPVPNVVGLTKGSAVKALKNAGFTVKTDILCSDTVAEGLILSQSAEGSARTGSNIKLYISAGKANTRGNTNSNASQGGFVAAQGDWIYYSNRSDSSIHAYASLYKMRTDGSEKQLLTTDIICSLNVVGEWIYYSGGSNYRYGIYKIKLDGSEKTRISKKAPFWMMVIGDDIYYHEKTSGDNICKMKTDGSGDVIVYQDDCTFPNIVGDWIYYINYYDNNIHKVRLDGTGHRIIHISPYIFLLYGEDDYLYTASQYSMLRISTKDDYCHYYATTPNLSYRYMNYHDGTLYLFQDDSRDSYNRVGTIRKRTADNTEDVEIIKVGDRNVFFIHVLGDWIYFPNTNDNDYLYRIKTDGTCLEKL